MSAVIYGLLNSTVGLLCTKLRDYTADRLVEGDINNDQLRQIVVREIDDIKTKLDSLSRKDLLASLSFFKEGVTRLYSSFEICEASDRPRFSKAQAKSGVSEVESETKTKAASQFPLPTQTECSALESAFELSETIASLKLASHERYKLAKESFKEAKRLATEAFNNVGLTTEDRLTASKLRIASRILEGFEDPDTAVRDCLLYLKELQDLPAVQAMFTVWRTSDKGITSRLRERFNRKKRTVHIESIQVINRLLINFTIKFTNIKIGLLNWPTVKSGPFATCYHPLLDNYKLQRKLGKQEDEKLPWLEKLNQTSELNHKTVLTRNGEILSVACILNASDELFIRKRSGVYEPFCRIPEEIKYGKICCFASDAAGNVHLLVKTDSMLSNFQLFMFDANGQEMRRRQISIELPNALQWRSYIYKPFFFSSVHMTVSSDGVMIVLFLSRANTMYIYDSTNTRQDCQFLLPKQCHKHGVPSASDRADEGIDLHKIACDFYSLTITDNYDIILGACLFGDSHHFQGKKRFIFVLTMDGQLKRCVEVPPMFKSGAWRDLSVGFNYVNETIILSSYEHRPIGKCESKSSSDSEESEDDSTEVKPSTIQRSQTMVAILSSNASEFLHVFHVVGRYRLLSHPSGRIVLAGENLIILQM